ncbi:glycosyltransferase involved in cell wall biosynthesis [Paenibacillus sp. PastM-3]|uniref:glycosyltransferase n=1 Tax=unclassified Paenibacillus TaxID=185978 RepID=UPI00247498E6|nr:MULTISPECIES: hypothetical protein [unclassified Paenibacillus]MDH6478191.1 glycosyltransferase involved in cell wall biosynthesis [Paenibacillus sp. PastH-2]MDH6506310.1 glycosyltransferase involved in cell wall biosynthesis [Paenibacillus sp. PastM-3]
MLQVNELRHNGYLVDSYREASPFARYLLRIGRNPQLAARLGTQGRIDALLSFEWDRTAVHLEQLYRSFLPH